MSYTGLIADAEHAQARGKQLLDEVVFFVVEGRAAKMGYRRRLHQRLPVFRFDESSLAAFPNAVRDHLHRLIQVQLFPFLCEWAAIFHFGHSLGMCQQLKAVRTFRAESPARDRGFRIALDGNQFPVFVEDQLTATHCAIRTYRASDLRALILRTKVLGAPAHCFGTGAVFTMQNLTEDWPLERKFPNHSSLQPVLRRTVPWCGCKGDGLRLKLNNCLTLCDDFTDWPVTVFYPTSTSPVRLVCAANPRPLRQVGFQIFPCSWSPRHRPIRMARKDLAIVDSFAMRLHTPKRCQDSDTAS